jgi:hypothetical protein
MSYRRRESKDTSLANKLSKTQRLAAVSSIRLVGPSVIWLDYIWKPFQTGR